MADLKQLVVKGALWASLERFGTQAIDFAVGIALARLLTPEDYGTVALTAIFFAVAQVLVDSGFGLALVQKKDVDDLDFNSVFYMSLVLAALVYTVLFFCAPLIAAFYGVSELIPIVRVSALCLFFNALNSIQAAEITRKMRFDLSFRVSVICSISAAVCGIVLAYLGWGAWALVWTGIAGSVANVISKWCIVAWRPRLVFSFTRIRPLFAFGWKMSVSALLDQFFAQLNGLLIGKFYTRADLAFVDKGKGLPMRAMTAVDATLGTVAFPALVRLQDDPERLRDAMRKMIKLSTFFVFPLMAGIGVCAAPLVALLFGAQWKAAVPYMYVSCFSYALSPLQSINLKGIMAMGRSDLFLKIDVIKKVVSIAVILLSIRHGVFVFVAVSAFTLGPLGVLINAWPNHKSLGYTIGMQLRDVAPAFLLALVLALSAWGVGVLFDVLLPVNGSYMLLVLRLALQGLVGAVVYLGLAARCHVSAFQEAWALVDRHIRHRPLAA